MPFNPTSEKRYRGGNAIHLMLTGTSRRYGDPRWLTYRQAQEKDWQDTSASFSGLVNGERENQLEFGSLHRQRLVNYGF
jgi:N-terminal domain of anti-restriction factor ArdC